MCFRNPESTNAGLLINVLFLHHYKQLHPFTMSSLKNMSFNHSRGVCYQFGPCKLCEQVNAETRSRNFSALEVQRVYRWQ